jgi:ferredoxin-NADP reductase
MRVAHAVARTFDAERDYLRARITRLAERKKFEEERHQHGWNGFRKFEIWRKVHEGGGICSFYLRPNDKKPLQPFFPGQFLTFRLQLPNDRQATTIRCYSLSDSPNPEYYRVSIKRSPPPRDASKTNLGASVSNFFHDQLGEGDIVDVKAPSGQFFLDVTHHTPVVLIGGGVGLTPVLSMLNSIIASGSRREVWFFYGVRFRDEHIMRDHLAEIARDHPHIRINVCYSDPTEHCAAGVDYQHGERVSSDLFKRLLPSNNYDYYLCGPPPMMSALFEGLSAWGVPEANIHFEAFGPATIKKLAEPEPAVPGAAAAPSIKVTFAKAGKALEWSAGKGSLLEFAEANGIAMASGCRAGNCGTCITAVKGGEVQYLSEPGDKPEAGSCLTCISVPKSALVLDA